MGKILGSTFHNEMMADEPFVNTTINSTWLKEVSVMKPGEKKTLSLKAGEAYGFYDSSLIIKLPRKDLPKELHIGDEFPVAIHKEEQPETTKLFRITKIETHEVTLDGNHPLAGKDLVFEINVTEIRTATDKDFKKEKRLEVLPQQTYLH